MSQESKRQKVSGSEHVKLDQQEEEEKQMERNEEDSNMEENDDGEDENDEEEGENGEDDEEEDEEAEEEEAQEPITALSLGIGRYVGEIGDKCNEIVVLDIRKVDGDEDRVSVEGFMECVGVLIARITGYVNRDRPGSNFFPFCFEIEVIQGAPRSPSNDSNIHGHLHRCRGMHRSLAEQRIALNTTMGYFSEFGSHRSVEIYLVTGKAQKRGTLLPIESSRLAASPHTLRSAQLWPADLESQLLLTSTIDVITKATSKYTATPFAVVLLSVYSIRMVGYLLSAAIRTRSSTIDIESEMGHEPTAFARLFGGVRQVALERFRCNGWAAASPFPKEVLQRWWKLAKETSGSSFPESLDSETEQAICGALLVEWIRQLLTTMCQLADDLGTVLLGGDVLELAMLNSLSDSAHVFRQLNGAVVVPTSCSAPKDLTILQAFELVELRVAQQGYLSFLEVRDPKNPVRLEDRFHFPSLIGKLESASILSILQDEPDIADTRYWYDHPHLLRRVAEQCGRGERVLNASNGVLAEYGIRPTNFRILWPPMCRPGGSTYPFKCEVDLTVTDASERDWKLTLNFNQYEGNLVTSEDKDGILAQMQVNFSPDFCTPRQRHPYHSIWEEFQPRLSNDQQQVLHHVRTALTHLRDAVNVGKCVQWDLLEQRQSFQFLESPAFRSHVFPSHVLSESDDYYYYLDDDDSDRDRPLSPNLMESTQNLEDKLVKDQRMQTFRQIGSLAYTLLDYGRWGPTRYVAKHSEDLRRAFQSSLIDGIMEANASTLLPTVLLDLIAAYHTIDSLPYLTPEEQAVLETEAVSSSN